MMSLGNESSALSPADRPSQITVGHLQKLALVYIRQSSHEQVRDHPGSAAAQRDLAELARRWGWPESRIKIIDCDLGLSGTSASNRSGFLELLALTAGGQVGMVFVQDVSRLSRRLGDFAQFAEVAQETGTLICKNGVIVDAENLGFQVEGVFGSYDNALRTRRFMDARIAKARRGQAVSPAPIGYIRAARGEWIKDPDRAVQDAILRVFDLYPRLASLGKVVTYFREHGLEFPRRSRGQVRWGPVNAALLHSVLCHPAYLGDYVFLRRQSKKRAGRTGVVVKFRSPEEWIVTHDHHEAYVSRDVWQRIHEMLALRRPRLRPLVGKGHALLPGLLRCGSCGRLMRTYYWGRDGIARTAKYTCLRQDGWGGPTHRVTFPARFLDQALVQQVLEAITAIDDETARGVIERSQLERATLERAHHRRLLDAEEDVQRARQLLLKLPPELQDARADLMAEYDAAARRHSKIKTQLASETVPSLSVTASDVGALVQRTRNIRQLWAAPQRTNEERKRLLQTVIAEVILHRADREGADLEIVWKGGFRQPLRALRARGVEALVAERTREGKSTPSIADELNAAGVVTATGRPVSPPLVARKQGHRGLRLKDERRLARQIIRQGLIDYRPRGEIRRQLEAEAPRLGPWDPQRLSEAIRQLRRGVLGIDPLPAMLPAEQEKQRVLDLIDQAIAAGRTWVQTAIALNEAGLRPPRGTAFTPVQVRLLFLRARGLRSFKLPGRVSGPEKSDA